MRADKIILRNWNYSLELNLLLKFCWFILEFSNSGLGFRISWNQGFTKIYITQACLYKVIQKSGIFWSQ